MNQVVVFNQNALFFFQYNLSSLVVIHILSHIVNAILPVLAYTRVTSFTGFHVTHWATSFSTVLVSLTGVIIFLPSWLIFGAIKFIHCSKVIQDVLNEFLINAVDVLTIFFKLSLFCCLFLT